MPNMKVEALGPVKQGKKGAFFTISSGGKWYNVEGGEDDRQRIANKTISATIRPSKDPKFNDWLKVDAVEEDKPKANGADTSAPAAPTGKPTWSEYAAVVKDAHALALELEPDELSKTLVEGEALPIELVKTDRSRTRASLVATILIAFGQGAFIIDDGGSPF